MSSQPVAVCYCRVSTEEQAMLGASLAAQEQALTAEATKRGFTPLVIRDEGYSAKNLKRPGMQEALSLLDKKKAKALFAVRLDRVSRSVFDFAGLMKRSDARHWSIVLLDNAIDTTTAAGKFSAHIFAAAAEFERGLISDRTKEGMAQRKAEGAVFGRTVADSTLPAYRRVLALQAEGMNPTDIARTLNAENVPTARGGAQWYPATVRRVLTSRTAERITQEA